MKVSVIVPTYNRSYLLIETINSILHQTFKDFELIIVDNCSSDNTEEVVTEFIKKDPRIKYFKHPNNGVIAINRNFGIKQAHGDFIAFCDDDDLWMTRKLEIQLEAFQKSPGMLGIATNALLFPLNLQVFKGNTDKIVTFKHNLKKNQISNSSMMIQREVVDRIGYLDENPELRSSEDWDYWMRILHYKDKSILILKAILLKYRIQDVDSWNFNSLRSYTLKKRLIHRAKIIYRKYYNENLKKMKKALKPYHNEALEAFYLFSFKKDKGFSHFLKNPLISPFRKMWILIIFIINNPQSNLLKNDLIRPFVQKTAILYNKMKKLR